MKRWYLLVAMLLLFLATLTAKQADAQKYGQSAYQMASDYQKPVFSEDSFKGDTIIIAKSRMERTYRPPTAVAKRPGHYTIADWRDVIDSTWGWGLSRDAKLNIFDTFWDRVDRQFASFNGIDVNWDSLGAVYRAEITNGNPIYGVSRGRFDAIMNQMALALKESHTDAEDLLIYNTVLEPGIPILVVGWFGGDQGHFGAGLTPLPDSSLLVYRVVDGHPLGLERGDVVLGYDRIPWKLLYRELIAAELPMAFLFWGACPTAFEHSFLMSAGMNWHLFDSIDVVKYSTGDTLHLSVAPLIGQDMHLICSEQIDIPGVLMPNVEQNNWISYGIIEGTDIGYIYSRAWSPDNVGDQFHDAVRVLVEEAYTTGLIIDFRTNYGGTPILANDGLSYFINGEELASDFAGRCNEEDHFLLCPVGAFGACQVTGRASPIYDKPVAVLTGPGALSAGDMNSLKFKFLPTARFFGKSTATAFNCPNYDISNMFADWYLRFAGLDEYLVDAPGQYLTHREFPVDENVWLTKDGVAQGRDDVVEAAVTWINGAQTNEPYLEFQPSSFNVTLARGDTASASIQIWNNGNWPLLNSLTPQISSQIISSGGGHDNIGNIWIDSDQPHGPNFNWIDITTIGTRIYLGDDNFLGPYDLGFDFPFYGQTFDSIYVGSNGILTFGQGSPDYTNDPIPSTMYPNNFIAPFWMDLNCNGRRVYYYRDLDNQRFIVSFITVPQYGTPGSLTFQAILYPSGEIDLNYGRIYPSSLGWPNWKTWFAPPATIGIENADGTDGLEIAYYENYMHDSLSIKIYPSWLVVSPPSGHEMPGEAVSAEIRFRAGNLPAGVYTGNIYLESNDPSSPSDTIPVTMNIETPLCPYTPGDINGNGIPNGLDVVYGVNYFKGGAAPPIQCDMCPQTIPFYAAGDVNGNCSFNGIDVTFFVRYLKGEVPNLLYCADCPPAGLNLLTPTIKPIEAPKLKTLGKEGNLK